MSEKVYFSKENLKRISELERFISILEPTEENQKQIEQYQKEVEDIQTYYTEDSKETITIEGGTRPLRVKDMRRKPLSLEQTIMDIFKEKGGFSIPEIRKLEGW